ncbi:hypothetical protein PHYSODRAFT_338620 [Phytophthora sojae]|uniref:Retrotransposon Copia-like N-terminal domain-containing protein n=1 Tax=Phytophthora sojae (strain P6497) TaxID=1094619 RepID=G5A2L6_PHYSP|nr:hypothetical protein PHYSODRAFT_338620 [Phytophthora sojae]EGZ09906.1 hypothetical protein PHYSODRAFT_338620 [Phytophthora sojae]|eukprot:XP_009534767.1 hypothetical protein PHYSODRAFT_338620 [Phytophthora sojae]
MSPTQASTSDDQPLLNSANYIIWKPRVIATLDGKHLLGFVMKPNYEGLSDTEDDDVVMELPEEDEDEAEFNPDRAELDSAGSALPDDAANDVSIGLPQILSFTEQKEEDARRAASKRRPKPNKRELRRPTAYEIFATIRERYEDKSLHGDPYYIQSFLMKLKYKEGTDLTLFFLKLEQTLHACSVSTNSSLSDEQQSIYLYLAMPTSWRNDLQIWKGTRKFIPVLKLLYKLPKRIPTCRLPSSRQTTGVTIVRARTTCRVLQRDLLAGRVKGGTVPPENFSVNVPNRGPTNSHPRGAHPNSRPKNGFRNNSNNRGYNRNNNSAGRKLQFDDTVEPFDRFGNSVSVDRESVDFQQRKNNKQTDYGIIAVTGPLVEHVSLAASVATPDLTWIVDSGSIRLLMEDTKGATRTVDLANVLYAPKLKFNLLSVPNAVRNDFKIVFDPKKCTLYYANRYKFFARLATSADLYQFKAVPATSTSPQPAEAHLAATAGSVSTQLGPCEETKQRVLRAPLLSQNDSSWCSITIQSITRQLSMMAGVAMTRMKALRVFGRPTRTLYSPMYTRSWWRYQWRRMVV